MVSLLLGLLLLGCASAYNPEENRSNRHPDVFEGDMILTPEQKLAAITGGDVDRPLGRGSIKYRRWPGGVLVYRIDRSLSRHSRAMSAIKAGMAEWTWKTCITFKKRTNERAYATFQIGSGCSSSVGRTGGYQTINLASGCWTTGIVAHEIGHALGFYHEQSRPDRDNYVTINWGYIQRGTEFNFKKYSRTTIDSLGTPYDYGSVMHYSASAFSNGRGRNTIVPKRPGVTIGQRRGLSPIDAQQMNLLYKSECSKKPGGGVGGGGGGSTGGGGEGGASCVDKNRKCKYWGKFCNSNRYVKMNCLKTCRRC